MSDKADPSLPAATVTMDDKIRRLETQEQVRDRLVNLLVHDLRTPLFNISASLDLLKMNPHLSMDPQALRNLSDAKDSISIMDQMLADILDVYKIEHGGSWPAPLPTPLCDIIVDAVHNLGGLIKHHHFSYSLPSPELKVLADPALTIRVLVNLLTNAIRRSPHGSDIVLKSEERDKEVCVGVKDRSPALESESAEVFFEKPGVVGSTDSSRRRAGGLGMVFSRMVVEAQGGKIGVEGKPGEGCVFWFTLMKPDS